MGTARKTLALAAAALCCIAQATDAAIINTSIKRVLDLTKHVVRVQTDIHFVDTEQQTNEYVFALPAAQATHLAHVTAKCSKTTCNVIPATSPMTDGVAKFTVVLQNGVAAGESGHIKLTTFFTRVLTPFPAQITQKDEQLVVFTDQHVALSPYPTTTQTTKVKLPSGRIESFSQIEPVSRKGATITYGPFADVAPLASAEPLRLHFKSHAPFLTVTTLVRELEVSMWGRVSVEEVYDVEHTGATLTGGFSRYDYTAQNDRGASFIDLQTILPVDAVNVYYRDQIGNISTSRLRPTATRQELALQPRFPLFGGWKTQFYLGYSVPTHSVLTRDAADNNKFKLTIDFSTALEHAAVDDLTVKVILPEGATNVHVNVPFAVDAVTNALRQTYLDTPLVGRPVVVVTKANVVAAHNVPFDVTFDFPTHFMLHEPLLLVGGFFAFFVVCMALFRLDVSLLKAPTTTATKHKTA